MKKKIDENQVHVSTDNGLGKGSLAARVKEMFSQTAPAVQEKQVIPLGKGLDKQSPLRVVYGVPFTPPPAQEKQENHNSVGHIGMQGPLCPVPDVPMLAPSPAQEEQENLNIAMDLDTQAPPGPVPVQEMPSQAIPSDQEDQVNLHIVQHLDWDSLPRLVQEMLSLASTPAELDILLISMLTAASACMPKLYFRYGPTSKHYSANLQAFIVAPPASGKGIAGQALRIVRVVDGCRPLIIPGNSTFPAFFTALHKQGGVGYMHESEGSVITDAWRGGVVDYNTALRQAAEHEPICRNRVATGIQKIDNPKLSFLVTGTYGQYNTLVPTVEDGYFSRLLTLFVSDTYPFDKRYVTTLGTQSAIPERIGTYLLNLMESMSDGEEKEWTLTDDQKTRLAEYMANEYKTFKQMLGENFHSTMVRMPIQIERIAMILSALRGNLDVCLDVDFQTALIIGNILLQHMALAFRYIGGDSQNVIPDIKSLDRRQLLFGQLPEEYSTGTLIVVAKNQGVPKRTAERWNDGWLNDGLVKKEKHGQYRKVEKIE